MTTSKPFFSIIMPVYNRSSFIVESVQTVLNQTFIDFELICVDDGSTDESPAILSKLASSDVRIKVLTQTNNGRCSARNLGIRAARGKWIAFLDSDDGYLFNHLEVMHQLIDKHPSMYGFATEMIMGLKVKDYDVFRFYSDYTVLDFNDFLRANAISLNQFCYSRKACPDLFFPDINILASEDFLFMRMFCYDHKLVKVNTVTNYVNQHAMRSINVIEADEFVKWNTFTSDYFIEHYKVSDKVKESIQSYVLLFSANILITAKKKKEGLKKIIAALKYKDTYFSFQLYKGLFKLLAEACVVLQGHFL